MLRYKIHIQMLALSTTDFVNPCRIDRTNDELCIEQGDSPQRGAYPAAFCWFQWIDMNP